MRPGAEVRAAHFPDLAGTRYLDTATQGVGPCAAATAMSDAVREWAGGTADYTRWEAAGERARGLAAGLLGRPDTEVALVPSQVAAAAMVAHRFPDAVVAVPEQEYRANLLPWTTSRPADRVRLIPAPATTERILAAIDGGAGLVAVSSVQSADGLRVDLARVVERAHASGALVYVDASQSFGVDAGLAASGADVIAAVGYKWLLGPRGLCYLMVRPGLRERVAPLLASPESAHDARHYGTHYRPWDDGRRFDQPPAWPALVGAVAGLELVSGFGAAALDAHSTALASRMRTGLARIGLDAVAEDRPSPIVAVRAGDPGAVVARLAAAGIRAAARTSLVRFAFHLYNDTADVDAALRVLADAASPQGATP
ncbi:selenocysteine lyase/cysteine desulfurase [Murinocardiopsis flavida]|uniref:Selenocysteine lyase/cysteine desulfurase n=1 Tax=Murinocardiopsis flavida TaxID=645275 RepID=A0A2P8CXI5_9ACTN|nr:aminotransferase class V-fold PLP-dependent enzyme [Murinocardiopsis flavida]PSK89691.1 selenocysteine lyase/cysteine desulfurase [Murinocardiopsis flavida]